MCPAHVFFVELFYLITSLFQITLLLVIVELVEHKLHLFIEFLIRSKEEMFGCLVSLSLSLGLDGPWLLWTIKAAQQAEYEM